jgi:type IV pilus assembly protein PilC
MPYYKCIFVNDKGNFIKKSIFGENRKEILNNYLNSDEKLISVKNDYKRSILQLKLTSKKIGGFEFLLFNQKLITLLISGVSFIRALEIILKNMKKGNFREMLNKIAADIRNGIQISDAFSSDSIPFIKIYRASLIAGEKSGNLEKILEKFNIYLEKVTNLRRKVLSSMSYPIILLIFMFSLVLFVLAYAIPEFSTVYDNFDAPLPAVTKFLISLGGFLQSNSLYIFLFILLIIGSIKITEKLNPNIVIVDYLKTKIPFIGKIIVENAMAIFSRTLSILIAGGIPIPEATEIAIGTFSNKYFAKKIMDVPMKIKEGNLLSDVLEEVNFVPGIVVEIIRVGESSGNLEGVLDSNADFFENSIDTKVNTMVSLIEPILIIVLGLVVMFMLLAIYVPLFNMVNVVGASRRGM